MLFSIVAQFWTCPPASIKVSVTPFLFTLLYLFLSLLGRLGCLMGLTHRVSNAVVYGSRLMNGTAGMCNLKSQSPVGSDLVAFAMA